MAFDGANYDDTVQFLLRTRDELCRRGWRTGGLIARETGAVCVLGAATLAAGWTTEQLIDYEYHGAGKVWQPELGPYDAVGGPGARLASALCFESVGEVYDWNDHSGSLAEVLAGLDQRITTLTGA